MGSGCRSTLADKQGQVALKHANKNIPNGRLRKYLPKNARIDLISQKDLDLIAEKMNRCPRKCIGYKTPKELFIQQYKNDCRIWS